MNNGIFACMHVKINLAGELPTRIIELKHQQNEREMQTIECSNAETIVQIFKYDKLEKEAKHSSHFTKSKQQGSIKWKNKKI